MKHILLTLTVFLLAAGLSAQEPKHVVFLKNKDNNPYSLSNPSAFLSQRSLDRRTKSGILPDEKDLPVTPSYITQIAATGATVVYPLKWFNAVVVRTTDPGVLAAIAALPFVDRIDQVLADLPSVRPQKEGMQSAITVLPTGHSSPLPAAPARKTGVFDYGQAYNQVHMIAADGLHDLGYTGSGMVIAVLDAGFYHVDQIPAFDSLWLTNRILGTRDFSVPGNNVFGEDMHTHGTSVLSTMGANLPGEMVGTAPHASYWLIRTEVGEYEALIEEYNWAAGAEFADSAGVDIINSSLGYTEFDNIAFNHTYQDMNGNTTPVTRAADLAASRGILVVNSAGNEGSSGWHYIGAPADGDSVFSIGAVNDAGNYASFSSVGPTYDGRIKPDVTAQGQGTTVVTGWGFVAQGSGTSYSSPVTAGALACLWQSMPAHSAQDIRQSVRNTASRATNPDNFYGWGIPNMLNAKTLLSSAHLNAGEESAYTLTPVPFSSAPVLRSLKPMAEKLSLELISSDGRVLWTGEKTMEGRSAVVLESLGNLDPGIYFLRVEGSQSRQVIRTIKL